MENGSISSEDSSESVTCHIQAAPMTQEQPWSKEEVVIALSNLPGGEVALSLIPVLHGDALQRVLEEFQSLTLNENADCSHRKFSLPTFANGYDNCVCNLTCCINLTCYIIKCINKMIDKNRIRHTYYNLLYIHICFYVENHVYFILLYKCIE